MEIELKIPLEPYFTSEDIISHISEKLRLPSEKFTQEDTYFQSPIRNFWLSDEALRIRRIYSESGNINVEISYKGPKQSENMKIREEITLGVSNSDTAMKILEKIGFQQFTTIKKERINWYDQEVTISFDTVEDLGPFLEIEIVESSENIQNISKSKAKIIQLAQTILPEWSGENERRSYLELKIIKQENDKGT
ncbi:MAG: class IV adenylate cyclase [Candidatus Hodarchaeales archaeon]|jgi:adenylate cyclase class 2